MKKAILNKRLEQQFQEWMDDGNVIKFEDGYATQDAQYTNRVETLDDLRRYFYKEFIKGSSDDYGTGGGVQKANVGLLLAGASLLQQRQAQKQGQRSKWEDRGMDYRQPQYYYPAPQIAQPQPTQPQNPMGQVDQQQLINALMMSKGKFETGGMPDINENLHQGFEKLMVCNSLGEAKNKADHWKKSLPSNDYIVVQEGNRFCLYMRDRSVIGKRVYGDGGMLGQTVKYKHWSGDIRSGVVLGMTDNGDYEVQYGTSTNMVKPNEIIEMHKRGGYPTGRAWTREHYHDNDAEDYEVDPRKRKVGARNRKFMAGGFTPNGYVTIIFNDKPHHFSAEYIGGQIEDIDLYSGDYAQDLANFIEKEFDEWLETAPKDYQSMYYGEYDEPAIYSKSGAIDQAYEYIEQDLIDMVKSGKKAVLDIDKGDFVEAFYAKGGNIFKSFEDFGKWFMGSRKQYPTGRAWTREHYHDNDDEDYEVDPKKRKVKARNRKYDVGGSTDGERYPRRADDTGKGINEGYVVETEMSNIDEDLIFETEEGLLNHLRSLNWEDADGNRSQDITDDDDLLEYFYNEDYYYWTQWDNSEIEDQGYYYTADGEEVEINARGGYPTGRAWTREHYHDNDDEDYEIDPNKRKVRARNRKYSFGGGIGEEVYIYEDIEAPDSRTVLIGDEVDDYIEEWNETMQTNYANWKEFNEGEEYYRILPLEEFKNGGGIFKSFEDFGRWFKGQSRTYPTGRAWTREHYHDNDAEDYEVDPQKRKVRARNRKYDVGGKTEKRYIILSPDGFPIYYDQTFTEEEIIPAFEEWKKRYERQGYYSTGNRERIPLEDLQHYCDIVEADENMFKNGGQLIGNQYKIDMNKNGRIDAEDFKILRSTMNGAWRNEHKHVNHSEDWETRYARKTNSSRTGYKGRKEYGDGGGIEEYATGKLVGKGSRGKNQYNKEVDAYKWFVVSDKNHVDSGWEYKEDATDQAKELSEGKFMGSSWKVMSLVTLKKKGIADPREDWKYKYSVGGFLLGTGVGAVLGNEIAKSGVKATASKIGKGASSLKSKIANDYAEFKQASKKKKITKFAVGGKTEVKQYADLSTIKPMVVNDGNVIKVPEIELKKTGKIVEFEGKKITSSDTASKIFFELWDKDLLEAQEQAYVLFLNNNNKPIGYYHHSSGGITATIMDTEIICAMAVKSLCKGVIVAHNHPSGNLTPSNNDNQCCANLKKALALFEIKLVDFLILTKNGIETNYTSYLDEGIM